MNYEQSVAFYEQREKFGVKLGLETVSDLLHRLGDPQLGQKYIHIAGTNGKGSTAAFCSNMLREAGYRTGLYTSPALERFNERIQINNKPVSDALIAENTTRIAEAVAQMEAEGANVPSQFELETALAFLCFQAEKTDIVVLEVGMGGRLDATNVITAPLVSVICSISLDHTRFLGNTLGAIAGEKAGIIKDNCPVVLYPQEREVEEVVKAVATSHHAALVLPDFSSVENHTTSLDGQAFDWTDSHEKKRHLKLSVMGDYQVANAIVAFTALDLLRQNGALSLTDEEMLTGLEKTRWKGRFEKILDAPLTILDGAHNPGGAKVFAQSVRNFLEGRKLVFVLGILADKKIDEMLAQFLPLADHVLTITPANPRAMDAKDLAKQIEATGKPAEAFDSLEQAWERAKALCPKENGGIVFVGSLYMIGVVRSYLCKKEK